MRALLVYSVPLVRTAPTLAIKLKVLLPPAGIETEELQVTVSASTRTQAQFAPFAPPIVSAAGQVIGAGSSSAKKIVPIEAASPLLLTVNW